MREKIKDLIQESIDMKEKLKEQAPIVEEITKKIVECYQQNKKVILMGNGGSAADAQHIAGEFVGRFFKERRALPALALHSNSSVMTALANDYDYDYVFKRQIEAYLNKGDVVIGISTSGNSKNVVEAMEYAKKIGGFTVAFVGKKSCLLDKIADIVLKIPSDSTPRIQEGHIIAGHIICYLVEEKLFGNTN